MRPYQPEPVKKSRSSGVAGVVGVQESSFGNQAGQWGANYRVPLAPSSELLKKWPFLSSVEKISPATARDAPSDLALRNSGRLQGGPWSLDICQTVFGNLTGGDARLTLWRGRPRPRSAALRATLERENLASAFGSRDLRANSF
jgi:hypothetical protein